MEVLWTASVINIQYLWGFVFFFLLRKKFWEYAVTCGPFLQTQIGVLWGTCFMSCGT